MRFLLLAVLRALLVGFDKGVSSERQAAVLDSLQGRIAQRFGAIRGGRLVAVRPRSGRATNALDRPAAFENKVVSNGRLNASKALAAIGSIVD